MRHFRAVFLIPIGASWLGAQQARDTVRTEPVVVTATRVPLTQGALPVAVTVILGEELRLRGITTVADALNDVSSAYLAQTGSQGAQTSLFLRGGESKYVKVLIDGVPANDPGGVFDFGSLTTDNVERIEVVRGPASVIHGADAVSGVVHVITRRGSGEARGELDVRSGSAPRSALAGASNGGSVRTWDLSGSAQGALSAGSYAFALARHTSTGLYEQNNEYLNNVLSARFAFAPVAGTDVRLALRYHDYQFNYPTNGAGIVADSNSYRTEDRTVIGLEVERHLGASIRTTLSLNSSVNDGGTDNAFDQPLPAGNSFVSQDKTRRRSAELRTQFLPTPSTFVTVGAQIEQQDQRSQSQSQSAFGPFNSVFRAARRNAGLYAEFVATPTPRVTATVGARMDDNEKFGQFTTGRVGVSWRVLDATRLRATAGSAFREPSFFENYASGLGNPDLRPEQSRSAEVGIEQQLLAGRAFVSVTGFLQRFRDIIDYTNTPTACGYNYCNVAEAEANGIEAELRAQLVGGLHAAVTGTLLETNVIDPGFDTTSGGLYKSGESLIRRPGQKWTGDLSYRGHRPLSAWARVLVVGERQDRDFSTFPSVPVTLHRYERLDVGAEYRVGPSVRGAPVLTARIENLLDKPYQNVFNFLAPRRTVSVGTRLTF